MSTKPPGGPLLTLLSLFITLTAYAISGNAVAPLISTLSARLGVPASSFGYIIALQYAVFALTSFGGGALKQRLRLSNYHAVSAGLVILSALFFVGAAALRSALALVLWVIPLGIAGSSVETFASIEISRLSDPGSSKNLCLSQVFYTLGALAAPQVVYFILGAGLSWKAAFVLFGSFSIAVFAFFLLSSLLRGKFAAPVPPPVPTADEVRARGILLAVMMVLMFVSMILESISGAWMAYLFELRHGLTARDASLVLVLYWVGMIASRLVILLLPARWTLWPALAVSVSGVLAVAACLALMPWLPARLALVCLLGFFIGPIWPVIVMTSSTGFQLERLTSAVIGMGAAGYALGPLLGSLILQRGWAPRFFLAHVLLGILLVALFLAARRLAIRTARSTL